MTAGAVPRVTNPRRTSATEVAVGRPNRPGIGRHEILSVVRWRSPRRCGRVEPGEESAMGTQGGNGGSWPPEGGGPPDDLPEIPPEWGVVVVPDDPGELADEA